MTRRELLKMTAAAAVAAPFLAELPAAATPVVSGVGAAEGAAALLAGKTLTASILGETVKFTLNRTTNGAACSLGWEATVNGKVYGDFVNIEGDLEDAAEECISLLAYHADDVLHFVKGIKRGPDIMSDYVNSGLIETEEGREQMRAELLALPPEAPPVYSIAEAE